MKLLEFPLFEYVWRGYNGTIGCEVRGARCEVRGARCEVRGARCEVRGARREARGARRAVCGARGTERTPFPAEATESCFFVRAVL